MYKITLLLQMADTELLVPYTLYVEDNPYIFNHKFKFGSVLPERTATEYFSFKLKLIQILKNPHQHVTLVCY